jgi:hypothetical protein
MEAVRHEIPETTGIAFRNTESMLYLSLSPDCPAEALRCSEEKERGMRFAHFVSIPKAAPIFLFESLVTH